MAATLCNEYSVTVNGVIYGDWYLPSKYELNLLYLQKNLVGGFSNYGYWTSTEMDISNGWAQNMGDGVQFGYLKISHTEYCNKSQKSYEKKIH